MGSSASRVVVGVDGSDSARQAVDWAAREAHERRLPLRVVHALAWPDTMLDPEAVLARRIADTPVGSSYREDLARTATQWLETAEAAALDRFPALNTDRVLVVGPPDRVLRDESKHADLLVVGSRGLGGFAGLLVGSVAVGLAARAACPVVVVRGDDPHDDGAPVLVGLDGSDSSAPALRLAAEWAARRGVPLEALFAWRDRYDVPGAADAEAAARAQLDAWLADLPDHHGDVEVRPLVVSAAPAKALVERTAGAQLVVVGSRGRGGLGGLLLGSVSHALLHHARCPVAVVGPAARRGDG